MSDVLQEFLDGRIGIYEDGDQNTTEFLSLVESFGLNWISGNRPTTHNFISKNMCMKMANYGFGYGNCLCREFIDSKATPPSLMTATEFLDEINSLKSADFTDFENILGA